VTKKLLLKFQRWLTKRKIITKPFEERKLIVPREIYSNYKDKANSIYSCGAKEPVKNHISETFTRKNYPKIVVNMMKNVMIQCLFKKEKFTRFKLWLKVLCVSDCTDSEMFRLLRLFQIFQIVQIIQIIQMTGLLRK